MMRCKAPFYMGGGTETKLKEFDLQRFAEVDNPYETIISSNIITSGSIQQPLVYLSYYARDNIANYETITTIPQENIEYLSSGLSASNCRGMFHRCSALISIPWNEFNIDTSQVIDMSYMFYYCRALTSLDLSNFNTSKVTSMGTMFRQCLRLKEIICPKGFDLSSCSNISDMFTSCNSYNGEPLHFKNVPRNLDFSMIGGIKGTHYVIDNYKN